MVVVLVLAAGVVAPTTGVESTVAHAGPPIAAVGVLIATVALLQVE